MNTQNQAFATPTDEQIKAIVEAAVDNDLPQFRMDGNWYTDYDMDSMGAVALVVEVRNVFGIQLPDDRMPNVRTGEQLRDIIVELSAAATNPVGVAA